MKWKVFILSGLVATLFLSACGKAEENSDKVVDETTTVTEEVKQEEPLEQATEEVVETVTEEQIAYPYTYVDSAGREVVIEEELSNIAVDYLPLWETLIMLDVMPVGATSAENYRNTWDAFAGYDVSSVIDLGNQVNLELLTSLEPEVIFSQTWDVANLEITNLEAIAPVVVFGPETKMDWRLSLRQVGAVLGKSEKAEEVIQNLDATLSDAKVKLLENYENQTVMQISVMGEDKYYYTYRPDLYSSETGLGLQVPEGYTSSETYEQITIEAIVEMNPDYLFLNIFDGDEAIYDELLANPTFQSLNAVKNNHVYKLDGSGHACSPLATLYTVEFMIDVLLNQ
jgi:iron complex transport system substrate-binding protein